MPVTPLAIVNTGMVTSVGHDSASSCAAIRCAIDNFQETRFMDEGGEWQIGSEVVLEEPWRGRTKLLKMAAMCIRECTSSLHDTDIASIPLLLCLPEHERPGRAIDDDDLFFADLQKESGYQFGDGSRVLAHGHTAAAVALKHARLLLEQGKTGKVLVVGVDSLLSGEVLKVLEEADRLLNSENSNGFIPGEAAAAILLERATQKDKPQLLIHGLGFAMEPAYLGSGLPLRADGLSAAIKASLKETGCEMHDIDYRITDVTGEHYYFKEASLALSRTLHKKVEELDIMHPTDCIGEAGAAIGPLVLAYQNYFSVNGHGKGKRVLAHFGDVDGKRAAVVMSYSGSSQ
jgi:3-oxoacyl-[acyl-carrier-protein] synthase-1